MAAGGEQAAAERAKRLVALTSVLAGVGLTGMKVAIGLATGSLGILAEAAHSGLDLVAALMTLLAVRLSGRPADASHPYGHGKVESLSAFLEAGLLLLTAGWIGYEAIGRLFVRPVHVDAGAWAFLVMAVSIAVDRSRSRALKRAAIEHHSPALAADALHFSTDIWSSAAVLAGLAAVRLGDWRGWSGPWERADAVAALVVCAVVLFVGGRLVVETIDALLDRAPEALAMQIAAAAVTVPEVVTCGAPRLRRVGSKVFADMAVSIPRTISFSGAHAATEAVERAVRAALPELEIDLVLHMEPVATAGESADETIRFLAREAGLRVHDVRVTRLNGRWLEADVHVEVDPALTLADTHRLADRLEAAARASLPELRNLNTHLEVLAPEVAARVEVTAERPDLEERIRRLVETLLGDGACDELRLYGAEAQPDRPYGGAQAHDLVLHVTFPGDLGMSEVHERSEGLERTLRLAVPGLVHILIHAEPPGS